jgi:hypothetical protein
VVARGRVKGTWNVKLDVLPLDANVIENISRVKLQVLQPGEEEEPLSRRNKLAVDSSSDDESNGNSDNFCPLTDSIYTMTVGDIPWEWDILPDGVHITEEENPLDLPDKLEFRGMDPDLFDSEENLLDTAAMFFKHVFPDVVGTIIFLYCTICLL